MNPRPFALLVLLVSLLLPSCSWAEGESGEERVFELRIYHANPGKLEALLTRFREHTCAIFERLGMENVGYWIEAEPVEGAEPKLYYVLAHPSREEAKAAWATFMNDAEWKQVYAESTKDGHLVNKVESIFLKSVDFSAIK